MAALRSRTSRWVFSVVCIMMLMLAAQNCDNVKVSVTTPPVVGSSAINPSLFGTLEPVLATRNPACIMCHAQINGDLITDLGNGNQFFMGTDSTSFHPNQTAYYGPFASKHFIWDGNTWSNSAIMGNVYVPNVTLTDSRLLDAYTGAGNLVPTTGLTLQQFM